MPGTQIFEEQGKLPEQYRHIRALLARPPSRSTGTQCDFYFHQSHWVWPLAKGFEQWQDDVKMYNIIWIWVEVCLSPMLPNI